MALITQNPEILPFGSTLPSFLVTDTDGRTIRSEELLAATNRGLVVVVTCNHCPYAQAYEDRTVALAKHTLSRGISWIAINPNAANPSYPDDSIGKMKSIVAAKKYPYPYAADMQQRAAKALGAACTPEYYLFDAAGALVYAGRLDDEMDAAKVKVNHLSLAIEDLLAGRPVANRQSHPIGCSIKWV